MRGIKDKNTVAKRRPPKERSIEGYFASYMENEARQNATNQQEEMKS